MSFSHDKTKKTSVSFISPKYQKKIGNYIVKETIGKGTFSKVCIGIHLPTSQKVAIKILQKNKIKDTIDIERINREISILKTTNHPNISQLYETLSTPNNYYIIMEYIQGGDLFDYIVKRKRLTEQQSCYFFRQIIACITYLHQMDIIHRDIKPENILLDKDAKMVKIIDFGLSNFCSKSEELKSSCGSPCYASPEMISGKPYKGAGTDIWSCGVVLYCMVYGLLPFDDDDLIVLYNKIKQGSFILPNTVSHSVRDLIFKMLQIDPYKRITLESIKDHKWFTIESNILYKGLYNEYDIIQVDCSIVTEIKQILFKEDDSVTESIIYQSVQNYLCNKFSAIYYLYKKSRNTQSRLPCFIGIDKITKADNLRLSHNKNNSIELKRTNNYNVFVINNIISSQDRSPASTICHDSRFPKVYNNNNHTIINKGATINVANISPLHTRNEPKELKLKTNLSSLSNTLSLNLNKSTTTPLKRNLTPMDRSPTFKRDQKKLMVNYIRNRIGKMNMKKGDFNKKPTDHSKYLYHSSKNDESIDIYMRHHRRNKSSNTTKVSEDRSLSKNTSNNKTIKVKMTSKHYNHKTTNMTSLNKSREKIMKKETIIRSILLKDKLNTSIYDNKTTNTNNNIRLVKKRDYSPCFNTLLSKSIINSHSKSKSKSNNKNKITPTAFGTSSSTLFSPKCKFNIYTKKNQELKEAILQKMSLPSTTSK